MIRQLLCEMGGEDAIVFDNPEYDDAIIGLSESGQVVYDYDLMIESLMRSDGMTEEDAADFICYNTIRACGYIENPPIIMHRLVDL